mgnify:CR=1 FL=1
MISTGFRTLVYKETLRFWKVAFQTVAAPVVTTLLYMLVFVVALQNARPPLHGTPFALFVAPGLIMMAVITNAYANVASSFFSAKFQRNVEELLVAPVPNYIIIAGYVGGGVARGLCVGLIVTLVSLFFVPLQIHHLFSVCFTVLLTSILFSLGGLINAVFAKSFDDISIIPTFILTPLTYLGGVFYSITLLPPFWQGVSQVNPIIYMVNAFRYGFLGISDVPLGTAYLIIIGFIVALYGLAWWLISRGTGLRH